MIYLLDFCGAEVVGVDLDDGFACLGVNAFFSFTLALPSAMGRSTIC
jgi:hypothetical protein